MLTHSDKISERIGVLVLRFARKKKKTKEKFNRYKVFTANKTSNAVALNYRVTSIIAERDTEGPRNVTLN